MTRLVVGLGNPGSQYEKTKHNIGFMVVDEWARQNNWRFNQSKFESLYVKTQVNGESVIVVKPQTFMNLSGRAVKAFVDYFDIAIEDVVIVYDDMDTVIGSIRLRQQGSAGGQNGMKDILAKLNTQSVSRIRVGIGRPFDFETVIQHVLSPFLGVYQDDVDRSINQATKALDMWVGENKRFDQVMNVYN